MTTSLLDLPIDVVLHILKFYTETESQLELLEHVSKVDLRWKDICFDYTLWKKYDGTLPFKRMMDLIQSNLFQETKEFTFSKTKFLKDSEVYEILYKLRNVEFLNFSNIEILSPNIFEALENSCPKLCKIQFQNHDKFSKLDKLTPSTLKMIEQNHLNAVTIEYQSNGNYRTYINDQETNDFKQINYVLLGSFLSAKGLLLLSIDFSYCLISNVSRILRYIADCCPNLEQLSLIGIFCSVSAFFPTEYLQKKCSKLRTLHLDYNIVISAEANPQGFPNLEDFSYYNPIKEVNCVEFISILPCSEKLKSLNLSGCHISLRYIHSLPAISLEHLILRNTHLYNSNCFHKVMKKWCHSLKEVDISFAEFHTNNAVRVNNATDKGILLLAKTPPNSPLEKLNLRGTKISAPTIKQVVENCHKLNELNLEECMCFEKCFQKVYYGKKELNKLL